MSERKPFDIRTDVTIECPRCRVYKTVDRTPELPARVRLITIICPDCDDGDFHSETWFSAPGVVVSQEEGNFLTVMPELDPDRLRDDRDERRRLAKEYPDDD